MHGSDLPSRNIYLGLESVEVPFYKQKMIESGSLAALSNPIIQSSPPALPATLELYLRPISSASSFSADLAVSLYFFWVKKHLKKFFLLKYS